MYAWDKKGKIYLQKCQRFVKKFFRSIQTPKKNVERQMYTTLSVGL